MSTKRASASGVWLVAALCGCARGAPAGAGVSPDGGLARADSGSAEGWTDAGANVDGGATEAGTDAAPDKPGPGAWPRTFYRRPFEKPMWSSQWRAWGYGVMRLGRDALVTVWGTDEKMDWDPGPGTDVRWEGDAGYVQRLTPGGAYAGTAAIVGNGWFTFAGADVAADGSIYISGGFENDVDFDPGPAKAMRKAEGADVLDAFVLKLGPDASFHWVYTFGGPRDDQANDVDLAPDGSVVVLGRFEDTVDFDPGPGTDMRTAPGYGAFALKLTSDGAPVWARTFAISDEPMDPMYEKAVHHGGHGVEVGPDGSVVLRGWAQDGYLPPIDYDPGPGEDRQPRGNFLMGMTPGGEHQWARVLPLGLSHIWIQTGLALTSDGAAAITGTFNTADQPPLDFDPGPGEDLRSSIRDSVFVTTFAPDGAYRWTRVFEGQVRPTGVFAGPDGALFSGGKITGGWADFGDGMWRGGSREHGYLTALGKDGAHQWTVMWPRMGPGESFGIVDAAVHGSEVWVGGLFEGKVDFDPGWGEDIRDSDIDGAMFITKFPLPM